MFKSVILWIFVLLSFTAKSLTASEPIIYNEEGDIQLHQPFKKLKKALLYGDGSELPLAKALFTDPRAEGENQKTWAMLVYAHVLLNNDSIAKAKRLINERIAAKNIHISDWVAAYQLYVQSALATYDANYLNAKELIELAEQKVDPNSEIGILLLRAEAKNLRYRGKLDNSLHNWYQALEALERTNTNDSVAIASIFYEIGVVRYLLGQVPEAYQDIDVGYHYFKRVGNKRKIAFGLSMQGLLEFRSKNYQEAIEKNLQAYAIRQEINDLKGQGESLNNLALAYMGMQNWSQALSYLEQAVERKVRAKDLTQMTVVLNNIGFCHSQLGHPEKALGYFNKALQKATTNGQYGEVLASYRNIIRHFEKLEDYKTAFETQEKLLHLKDSLANLQRIESLAELEVRYETQKKEQEILLLQQQQAIITNRWLTVAVGLFFVIILGILILDNQKRKHRQQTEILKKEDQLKQAEIKNMANLLEYNKKKLSLYTENLLKKNQLVSQLEDKLQTVVANGSQEQHQHKKIVNDFSSVRILTEEDWEEFKGLFDSVHQGLLDRLLDQYQDLTMAEQRLFLLMKLKLSTKEIANILGVSPDSVKKGRYRLKKKIGAEEGVSIQDFVSSF